jgi:hypothetical protein
MSSRLSSFNYCLVWVVLCLGIAMPCGAQQKARKWRGAPINFDSKSSDPITNLNQLINKPDSRRQLDAESGSALQSLFPKDSFDGMPAPSYVLPGNRPIVIDRRAKEKLEREKNWMWMSPEDLVAGQGMDDKLKDDPFGAEDGRKKLTRMETWFLHQDRQTKDSLDKKDKSDRSDENSKSKERRDDADDTNASDDSILPGGVKATHDDLKKQLNQLKNDLGANATASPSTRGFAFDVFALGDKPLSAEEKKHHDQLMNQYSELYRSPSSPIPDLFKDANPLAETPRAAVAPIPSLGGFSNPSRRDAFDSQLGSSGSFIPLSSGFSDSFARGFTPLSQPVIQKFDVQPKVTPPTPTFGPPRRVF